MFTCWGIADSRLPCVILWSAVCLLTDWNHMQGHFCEHDNLYRSVPLVMFDVKWCVSCIWMSFFWSDASRFHPIRDDVRDFMYVYENWYVEMCM